MKKIFITLFTAVLLVCFFTYCQKEEQVKEWIPFKVQVNPVEVTGEGLGEFKNMNLLVDQTIQVLENRIKLFDVKNFKITKVSNFNDQLIIEMPQKDIVIKKEGGEVKINPFHLISNLCAYPEYKIELKLCTEGPHPFRENLLQFYNGKIPETMEIVSGIVDNNRLYYTVLKETIVSSKDLYDGEVFTDQNGEIGLKFKLNDEGAKRLKELTSKNIGKNLAILLDDKLLLSPTIYGPVSDEVQIIGGIDPTLAMIMAVLMKAGPLPGQMVLPSSVKVFDIKLELTIQVGKDNKK